ncbi:MAG TPA: permease [Candidatus Limnocylindrales bacterium]
MEAVTFATHVITQVLTSISHNWPYLLLGIVSASAIKLYVGTDRIAGLLRRQTPVAVGGAVAAAVGTPFCSCGTTAVVLSMLASSVPWAPIVAFMVASPLTSPDELFVSAGLFGWSFALFFFASSIVLGIAGGVAAHLAEKAGLLDNQARFLERSESRIGAMPSLGPGAASVVEFEPFWVRWRMIELGREVMTLAPKMLLMFVGFATIGYAAIELIPQAWMTALLGGSNPLSVVVAATLGIPLYVSSEGNLPLIASLMHGGMGPGPAMAFLITGAGTSIGAISGGLLIARWRVIATVVGTLWVGGIILGLIAGAIL